MSPFWIPRKHQKMFSVFRRSKKGTLAKYGLLSLSLIDLFILIKGGENVLVWKSMEELRGENRGSYITG